ncbi:MAG: TetR family transcriptional regulator, partial [Actinobacteria bacterium]|nr:TetR family transcriptional regulator [Actinomycetota bacterium]
MPGEFLTTCRLLREGSTMPTTKPLAPKRSYLRPPERRRQLLDATTAVVRRDGLTALTMVAVAAEAGVSRRLVYNHFPDLATLARTFVADRLMTFMADTESEFNSESRSRSEVARSIFVRLSAVPAEDRLLLRTLLVGAGPVELNGIQELIEERM